MKLEGKKSVQLSKNIFDWDSPYIRICFLTEKIFEPFSFSIGDKINMFLEFFQKVLAGNRKHPICPPRVAVGRSFFSCAQSSNNTKSEKEIRKVRCEFFRFCRCRNRMPFKPPVAF